MSRAGARAGARSADRFVGRSALGLTGLAAVAVLFGLVVALVETGSPLLAVDRGLSAWLNGAVAGRPLVVEVLGVVTDFGGWPASALALSTLTVALLVRRQPRLAGFVAVAGLGAAVLSPVVKELVGRLRPMVAEPVAPAGGPSFPSGHAFGSAVTFGVVLLVLLPVVPGRWHRAVVVATAAFVVVIGFTRLALGVHYLSDVLGGWLLAIGWLAITTTAFRAWRRSLGMVPTDGVTHGLAPDAAPALSPAPHATHPVLTRPRQRAAVLGVVWVLLLGLLLGTGWLITQVLVTTWVDRLDTAAMQWFLEQRTPARTEVMTVVTRIGGTPVIIGLALASAALALAVTRRWRPALFLAVVMAGEATLFLTSGSIISRPRPFVPHLGPELVTSSFPSGHVTATISLYGGIAVLVLGWTRAWWRWLMLAVAVLLALAVALSRFYFGVHHPTDVLGSIVLAVPWLLACRHVLRPGRVQR